MIAFASLFLGLTFGMEQVELVVGTSVSSVELRLDGESLGVLRQAPWKLACDLGKELAPRHLEAIAFDAEGEELARASQWINLPTPRAAASVVLEPREEGKNRVARLSWESAAGAEPESIEVTLDGQKLKVDDPHRIVLPPVDEKQFHLLHIALQFEGRVSSRVDLTFGGSYVDEVSTEITALPLVADRGGKKGPSLQEAQGWFLKGDKTLPVLAIERETAEVVIVMDRAFPHLLQPGERFKPPKSLYLPADYRLRFLSTVSEESQGVATIFNLFPISPAYGGDVGDLYSILTRMSRPPQKTPPRPQAGVAVAGLAAYEGRHRRAVILIPSAKSRDDEVISPDQVRRYLRRLRVPFFVWEPRSRPSRHLAAWGDVRAVGTVKDLAAAFDEVAAQLERQWIVWLDGRHLPQDITLAPTVKDYSLSN